VVGALPQQVQIHVAEGGGEAVGILRLELAPGRVGPPNPVGKRDLIPRERRLEEAGRVDLAHGRRGDALDLRHDPGPGHPRPEGPDDENGPAGLAVDVRPQHRERVTVATHHEGVDRLTW
jgi:hypothetical protein